MANRSTTARRRTPLVARSKPDRPHCVVGRHCILYPRSELRQGEHDTCRTPPTLRFCGLSDSMGSRRDALAASNHPFGAVTKRVFRVQVDCLGTRKYQVRGSRSFSANLHDDRHQTAFLTSHASSWLPHAAEADAKDEEKQRDDPQRQEHRQQHDRHRVVRFGGGLPSRSAVVRLVAMLAHAYG